MSEAETQSDGEGFEVHLVDAWRERWRREWSCRWKQDGVLSSGGDQTAALRSLLAFIPLLVDLADPGSGACPMPPDTTQLADMLGAAAREVPGLYAAAEALGAADLLRDDGGEVVRYRLNRRWLIDGGPDAQDFRRALG